MAATERPNALTRSRGVGQSSVAFRGPARRPKGVEPADFLYASIELASIPDLLRQGFARKSSAHEQSAKARIARINILTIWPLTDISKRRASAWSRFSAA